MSANYFLEKSWNASVNKTSTINSETANTTPTGATVSKAFRNYPNNFVFSGLKSSRFTFGSRGSNGYYYSSTSYNSSCAKFLILDSSSISPDEYNQIIKSIAVCPSVVSQTINP